MSARNSLREGGTERGRTVIAAVGYVAVVLAVLTAFVPVVGDAVVGTIGVVVGSPLLVVLLGLVGGGYGLHQLYRTGRDEVERAPIVGRNPERAHYREKHVVGADVDASIEAIDGELPESAAKNWWTYREKRDVKRAMVSVAVDVLASEHDVSRKAATEIVEDGSWTDDERAATFLGGENAGSIPLRTQFFDWLSGAAYERRAEATIDEIAAHAGLRREDAADGDGTEVPAEVVEAATAIGDSTTSSEGSATNWSVDDTDFDAEIGDEQSESDDQPDPDPVVETPEGSAEPYPINDGGSHGAWSGGDDE